MILLHLEETWARTDHFQKVDPPIIPTPVVALGHAEDVTCGPFFWMTQMLIGHRLQRTSQPVSGIVNQAMQSAAAVVSHEFDYLFTPGGRCHIDRQYLQSIVFDSLQKLWMSGRGNNSPIRASQRPPHHF